MGTLFIITAPSGAGKTSLVKALLASTDCLQVSISHTTRSKRQGEQDGVDYHFIDKPRFAKMVEENQFLEHASVFGYHYGTSRDWVMAQLEQGQDIILEIDWQGAALVHQQLPSSVMIFVLPPSLATLKQRLHDRGQDDEPVIAKRLSEAGQEISHCREFDYIIVNDVFDTALADFKAIVRATRLREGLQLHKHKALLEDLLKK